MANLKIDVRIFSGKTLEEAAEKANNHPHCRSMVRLRHLMCFEMEMSSK